MTSYLCIDRIEGKYAVCEVELIPFKESKPEEYATKPTTMMDFPLQEIPIDVMGVKEGDILVVEHDCNQITFIYYKDEEEKARRQEVLKTIKG